jgi:hypothetical protein
VAPKPGYTTCFSSSVTTPGVLNPVISCKAMADKGIWRKYGGGTMARNGRFWNPRKLGALVHAPEYPRAVVPRFFAAMPIPHRRQHHHRDRGYRRDAIAAARRSSPLWEVPWGCHDRPWRWKSRYEHVPLFRLDFWAPTA